MNPVGIARTLLLILALVNSGCSTTGPTAPHDPWEGFNRSMFEFNDALDKAVLKPTAEVYVDVVPGFMRTGVSNVFSNLDDVIVALNDLLQFKIGHAASDASRFVLNSTLGLFGLIDIASDLGIPKRNEDFGQTLGHYGVGAGPYLVLPLFGPRTLRGTSTFVVDSPLHPVQDIRPDDTRLAVQGLDVVATRANLLSAGNVAEAAALDPYIFIRDAYLQQRASLVADGAAGARQESGEERDELDELDELDKLDELEELEGLEPAQ